MFVPLYFLLVLWHFKSTKFWLCLANLNCIQLKCAAKSFIHLCFIRSYNCWMRHGVLWGHCELVFLFFIYWNSNLAQLFITLSFNDVIHETIFFYFINCTLKQIFPYYVLFANCRHALYHHIDMGIFEINYHSQN